MKCSRCQNEDVQYFFENNGRIYCRKCIAFSTKTVNLKPVKNEKKIYYHLNYSLNLEQERTSRLLIERYQNHQNTVLKAVTGAGKTEMIYGVIEYALNLGHEKHDQLRGLLGSCPFILRMRNRAKRSGREAAQYHSYHDG